MEQRGEMKSTNLIIKRKGLLGNRPTIKGTRISVDNISTYLSNGYGIEDIREAYPFLSNEQIQAALDFLDLQVHKERNKLGIQTI